MGVYIGIYYSKKNFKNIDTRISITELQKQIKSIKNPEVDQQNFSSGLKKTQEELLLSVDRIKETQNKIINESNVLGDTTMSKDGTVPINYNQLIQHLDNIVIKNDTKTAAIQNKINSFVEKRELMLRNQKESIGKIKEFRDNLQEYEMLSTLSSENIAELEQKMQSALAFKKEISTIDKTLAPLIDESKMLIDENIEKSY